MLAQGCDKPWEINTKKNKMHSKNVMLTHAKYNINADIYDLLCIWKKIQPVHNIL